MSAVIENSTESSRSNYKLPSGTTYSIVLNLSIVEDKPIMFRLLDASCDKEVLIALVKMMKTTSKKRRRIY